MTVFSNSFIKGYVSLNSVFDRPFYASELGLNGGVINGLRYYGIIRPTGNSKEYSIPHPYIDKFLIRCKVAEWVVNKKSYDSFKEAMKKDISEMKNVIALCESLGL